MADTHALDVLIQSLRRLPGVGIKSAQRMAFHLLQHDREGAQAGGDDGVVFAGVVEGGRLLAPGDELVRLARHGGNDDGDVESGLDLALDVDGANWHASLRPVKLEGAKPLFLITAIPDNELMDAAERLMRHAAIATALVILLAIPITWVMARRISGPLRQLAHEAEAIRRFEFSQPIKVNSLVLEVSNLTLTMDSMKRTIRRFLDINMAVAAENDFDRLLPRLLGETLPGHRAGRRERPRT